MSHDPAANPHNTIMELKRELIDHDPNLEPQLSAHNHSCNNNIRKMIKPLDIVCWLKYQNIYCSSYTGGEDTNIANCSWWLRIQFGTNGIKWIQIQQINYAACFQHKVNPCKHLQNPHTGVLTCIYTRTLYIYTLIILLGVTACLFLYAKELILLFVYKYLHIFCQPVF